MPLTLKKFRDALRGLTISTKTMISSIVASTSILQIQQARDFVIAKTVAHPRITSIVMGIAAVLVVLHNPKVQKFLHIEQETNFETPAGNPVQIKTDTTVSVPQPPTT
jgi:hypothetical protein